MDEHLCFDLRPPVGATGTAGGEAGAQADAGGAIAFGLYSRRGTRLTAQVNGTRLDSIEVAAGWSTVTAPLPPGALVAGEHTITLRYRRRAAALEWLQLGGAAPSGAGVPEVFDDQALLLAEGDGLAYYVQVPIGGRLVGDVLGDGCAVSVRAIAHDGEASGALRGAGGAVDLSALAGRVVRREQGGSGCRAGRLGGAARAVSGREPGGRDGPAPKYVGLGIMDTRRADPIELFRPGACADVPNWERLAERGVVFRNAYVQGNESQASHASIWTSAYPVNHGINISIPNGPWKLDNKLAMLGRLMHRAGLYTTGVTANGFITRGARYGAGFDAFSNPMRDGHGKRLNGKIPSNMIWSRVLASLDGKTDRPFFLFIGTIDTHKPWVAREPWISKYDPKPYKGKFERIVWGGAVGVKKGRMISTERQSPRDLERILALYDCGVSYQDLYVGKLLDKLDEWGIAEQTMFIVTADHGEELWEEGRVGHGATLRQSLVHVPMLISYPPLMPPGVVDEGAETLDILPTILDALGQDVPDAVQGESLIPLAQGVGRGYPRPAIASQYEYHHAMSLGGWKIRANKKRKEARRVLVYDLTNDYDERHNVAAERPIETRFLTDALGVYLVAHREWRKLRWGVASNMTARAPLALPARTF